MEWQEAKAHLEEKRDSADECCAVSIMVEVEALRALLARLEELERDRENLIYERDMEHREHVAAEAKLAEAQAQLARVVEAAQMLGGSVGDVLQGWDAHRQLAQGFGGMGHNILVESAARYSSISCWMRVRKHYDALVAALAAAEPEGGEGSR